MSIGTVDHPQLVIIECDENQHLSYDITNETMRESMIHHILDGIPTILLRFNPSMFKKKNQDKRTQLEWEVREHVLCTILSKCMVPKHEDTSLFTVFGTHSHITLLVCYDMISTETDSSSVLLENEEYVRRRVYDCSLVQLTKGFVRV